MDLSEMCKITMPPTTRKILCNTLPSFLHIFKAATTASPEFWVDPASSTASHMWAPLCRTQEARPWTSR